MRKLSRWLRDRQEDTDQGPGMGRHAQRGRHCGPTMPFKGPSSSSSADCPEALPRVPPLPPQLFFPASSSCPPSCPSLPPPEDPCPPLPRAPEMHRKQRKVLEGRMAGSGLRSLGERKLHPEIPHLSVSGRRPQTNTPRECIWEGGAGLRAASAAPAARAQCLTPHTPCHLPT